MTRCEFEQTNNAVAARRLMYEANDAFKKADLVTAQKLYKQGFDKWRLVINEFPSILDDEASTGEDILDYVKAYRKVLDQLDERLDDDFPLWEVIEKFDVEQDFTEEIKEHQQRQDGATDAKENEASTESPAASEPSGETSDATEDSQSQTPSSEPAADDAEK
jgi:hypothetical protein